MKLTALLNVMIFFLMTGVSAQTLTYSVKWRNDSVGVVKVYKYDSLGFKVYRINSEVNFWLFGSNEILTDYLSVYQDNSLISSSSSLHRNKKLREHTSVKWEDDNYVIHSDSKTERIEDPIRHSVGSLYHNEPVNVPFIFSERFGALMPLQKDGDGYVLTKPDGRENYYEFEEGICKKVKVNNAIFDIHLELVH